MTHGSYLVLLLSSKKFCQLCTRAVVPDEKWILCITIQQLQHLRLAHKPVYLLILFISAAVQLRK